MADAYFRPLGALRHAGGRYEADASTGGPWDRAQQHGGPPSALLVRCAEHCVQQETGRSDLVAVRYAAEFVGPVPVGTVTVTATIVRAARSAVLVAARLEAGDRACLDARIWLVRDADTSTIAHLGKRLPVIEDAPGLGGSFPYGESIEWRVQSGGLAELGPGVVWARPRQPVVPDETMSGLQRAVLIGDSASGISSELDWGRWTFLNIDLEVHLARPVRGDWIRMDAATQLGGHGSALTRSTLSDEFGEFGCTAQTLILAPRMPTPAVDNR